VAVAVGAAVAWRLQDIVGAGFAPEFFGEILRLTPESQVRRGILLASQTPADLPMTDVARALGNGSLVTAPDTVPFCIWMAAHNPGHFVEAIGKTISTGGDCDTNAAIVGGIVSLSAGRSGLPEDWLRAREKVSF
jgi:ADP-ribosylglycohydrolase